MLIGEELTFDRSCETLSDANKRSPLPSEICEVSLFFIFSWAFMLIGEELRFDRSCETLSYAPSWMLRKLLLLMLSVASLSPSIIWDWFSGDKSSTLVWVDISENSLAFVWVDMSDWFRLIEDEASLRFGSLLLEFPVVLYNHRPVFSTNCPWSLASKDFSWYFFWFCFSWLCFSPSRFWILIILQPFSRF